MNRKDLANWWMSATTEERRENKRLCDKFPFLIPSNWSGNSDEMPKWNYEYTELDEMPPGWRKAFGEQMCEEIMEELKASNMIDTYMVLQIKEKFGMLRWYDNGFTKKGFDIISKYEDMSKRICIACGKPATLISTGWISPWCDECAEQISDHMVPINEFYRNYGEEDA